MSEATEVPMMCVDCGGTLTDDDAIWSSSPSSFSHINYSQCFSSLNERLTAATERAEAAEARRREIDDEAFAYAEQIEVLRRECDALRKVAKDAISYMVCKVVACNGLKCREGNCESCCDTDDAAEYVKKSREAIAALTAALAVQP